MRAVLLGTGADVRGMMLAGLPGIVCRTRREAEAAFDRIEAEASAVALVLLSAPVAALVPGRVAGLEARPEGPVALVLPEPGDEGAR